METFFIAIRNSAQSMSESGEPLKRPPDLRPEVYRLMKAIGYRKVGPPAVMENLDLPVPDPGFHDLLVKVQAVSVNPIDTKLRMTTKPPSDGVGIRLRNC